MVIHKLESGKSRTIQVTNADFRQHFSCTFDGIIVESNITGDIIGSSITVLISETRLIKRKNSFVFRIPIIYGFDVFKIELMFSTRLGPKKSQ